MEVTVALFTGELGVSGIDSFAVISDVEMDWRPSFDFEVRIEGVDSGRSPEKKGFNLAAGLEGVLFELSALAV